MKKLTFLLVGLLLVPFVSFAQTTVSRETLLAEIAQLEAELSLIEQQVVTTTPVPVFIMPTPLETATSTVSNDKGCSWNINYVGQKFYRCVGG